MWRSWKGKGQEHAAHPHMEWGRQWVSVNHFYFYLWDPDWGGAFWKTNAYAPWPVWIWLNGHTWAQRQSSRAGIGYTALDNGFRDCEHPAALQKICDRLGSGAVKTFFWRWQRRLPSPLTRADVRGLRLRAGVSPVRDFRHPGVRPARGRAVVFRAAHPRSPSTWAGPDSVSLIFDRRISTRTPGTWRTRVITKGVDPQISCDYRSSRIKQYLQGAPGVAHRNRHLQHPRLRHRPAGDRRELESPLRGGWLASRANQRLCDAKPPMPDCSGRGHLHPGHPTIAIDGQHAPALPFGDRG